MLWYELVHALTMKWFAESTESTESTGSEFSLLRKWWEKMFILVHGFLEDVHGTLYEVDGACFGHV